MPAFAPLRSRSAKLVVTIMAAVAGCAGVAAPATPAPGTPPPTTSPMATPSAPPAFTPAPSTPVVTALPEGDRELFPGRYTTHFEPALILTIDREVTLDCVPGYRCRGDVEVNTRHWLGVEFGHDHPVEMFAFSFVKVSDPKHPDRFIDPPADLATWISGLPGVTLVDRKAVVVGGIDATQVDLLTARDVTVGRSDGLVEFPTLGFSGHQLRRVTLIRRADAAVVIAIGSVDSTEDPTRLAEVAKILQPIVDSITWQ